MSKPKIAAYLALIFLAGAVAGGTIVLSSPSLFAPPRRVIKHGSPEDFAKHLFERMTERLQLTPEQVQQAEPIFRAGFDEVRSIQDRSLREVSAAIKRNHEELGKVLTAEQRAELAEMDREHRDFLSKRSGKPRPPGPPDKI